LFHQEGKDMKNLTDKIVVRQIEWMNNEADMHITCTVRNGFFEYNTTLVLPGFELNKVLLKLQKQHVEFDVQDCLKIEQWEEEEFRYLFDFSELTEKEFVFGSQTISENMKQIRA